VNVLTGIRNSTGLIVYTDIQYSTYLYPSTLALATEIRRLALRIEQIRDSYLTVS